MCMALSLIAGCNKLSDCSCEDQYVIVTKHGVKADGKTDVSDAIQKVIDNNPNRTIFFPDGVYLLSKSIITPADPEKSVHLVLANYATLKAKDWNQGGALVRLGGKDPKNSITINGSNYGFYGGIIDGSGVADGISIDGGRETRVENVSIKHVQTGLIIKYGANSGSSDSDIINVNIVGNDTKTSIGVLVEGYDNTFTNMRIASVHTGVWCKTGGNSFRNIHPLFIFNDKQEYESSIGFLVQGGNNFMNYCYSDQFATGFKIEGPHDIDMTDCFCWYYSGKVPFQTAIECTDVMNTFVSGFKVGFSKDCENVAILKAKLGGKGAIVNTAVPDRQLSSEDVSKYYMK